MVAISAHYFHPFGDECSVAFVAADIQLPVAHFSPDDIPVFIAVVQEQWFKCLFVQACSVESRLHRQNDVSLKVMGVGCCIYASRVEALIKHQTLEYRFAVNQESITLRANLT